MSTIFVDTSKGVSPDGIHPLDLKNCASSLLDPLSVIFKVASLKFVHVSFEGWYVLCDMQVDFCKILPIGFRLKLLNPPVSIGMFFSKLPLILAEKQLSPYRR